MPEAYIVEAVRTPVGKKNGGLSTAHPADLGAHVLKELVARAGIDPAVVEDVVFGCLDTLGPQAGDIARTAWLAAGLPEEVPGTTIDRQCGSSQQAVHFAAQGVMSGTQDVVIAGGVQNMSQIPIGSAFRAAAALGLDPRGVRARAQGAQPDATRAGASHVGPRCRPDLHADRADPGDRARPRQDRDVPG